MIFSSAIKIFIHLTHHYYVFLLYNRPTPGLMDQKAIGKTYLIKITVEYEWNYINGPFLQIYNLY